MRALLHTLRHSSSFRQCDIRGTDIRLSSRQSAPETLGTLLYNVFFKSIKRLREITGLTQLIEEVRKRKLKWFGHIRRSTLPIKAILEERRKRGRPHRRSKDDIKEGTILECYEPYTKDRVNWRSLCNARCNP